MICFRATTSSKLVYDIITSRDFIDLISMYIDQTYRDWYNEDYAAQLEGYYITSLYYLLCGSSIDSVTEKYLLRNLTISQEKIRTPLNEEINTFILRSHQWTIVRKV